MAVVMVVVMMMVVVANYAQPIQRPFLLLCGRVLGMDREGATGVQVRYRLESQDKFAPIERSGARCMHVYLRILFISRQSLAHFNANGPNKNEIRIFRSTAQRHASRPEPIVGSTDCPGPPWRGAHKVPHRQVAPTYRDANLAR